MKKSLNVLCIVLVIMMLCACTKDPVSGNNTSTTPPATEEPSGEVKSWDGPIATSFSGGSGTKDDPYQIATAAELAYLASRVNNAVETYKNKYIELTADIDLEGRSWIPIGLSVVYAGGQCFMGSFNGNNHTVTNMLLDDSSVVEIDEGSINIGLFGVVEDGTIENLIVSNSNMNYSATGYNTVRSGAIVGAVLDGVVKNCSAFVDVHTKYEVSKSNSMDQYNVYALGGIVGIIGRSEIDSCHFIGSIYAAASISSDELEDDHIDVFVGGVSGDATLSKVLNCSSNGYVTTGFKTGRVKVPSPYIIRYALGGISGEALGTEMERNLSKTTVTALFDVSEVVSPENTQYMFPGAGGLVGYVSDYKNTPSVINECASMGDVGIDCAVGFICSGGLVGTLRDDSELLNSYAIGKVVAISTEDQIQIGGISGMCLGAYLENCYSSSRLSYSDSRYAAGGIIGYSEEEDGNIVNNCYYQRNATDTNNGIGTPLSKSQMKDPTYYKGFDFDDVWEISDNPEHGYLKLKNVVYD